MNKTKMILTVFVLVASTWLAKAQTCSSGSCNIGSCEQVCNGGFNYYSSLPTAISTAANQQIQKACGWSNLVSAYTPDYFHSAASVTDCAIPCNFQGTENYLFDDGYVGLLATINWKEAILTNLNTGVNTGEVFEVSAELSLADAAGYNALNSFGFNIVGAMGGPIYFNTSSVTSSGWTRVSATFTAIGYGSILQIGFLAIPSGSNLIQTNFNPLDCDGNYNSDLAGNAYYYMDNVSIRRVEQTTVTASALTGCTGEAFTLTGSGADTYTWTPSVGTASVGNPLSVTPTVTTVYSVTATNTNACVMTPATITITPAACCTNTASGNITLRDVKLVPYGTGGGATPWSNLVSGGFYTGTVEVPNGGTITNTLTVVGSLTIAAAVNLYTCDIALSEDAPIYQYSVTNINNSYLRGCDKLWAGIKTYTNLSITNSWIEDAYIAVDIGDLFPLSSHPYFNCDNVLFSKNYIAIGLGPVTMNPDNFRITGSIFSCRRFGPANYTTSTRYTTLFPNVAGKLPQKLLGSSAHGVTANTIRSNIGIELGEPTATGTATFFTIGAATSSSTSPTNSDLANLFDYVNEGIYNYHTKLSVINNRFSNIKTESGSTGTSLGAIYHDGQYGETLTKTEVGRFSAGSPSTSDYKNVFGYGTSTILDGITAVKGGTLTVNYNDFIGISRYGVNVKTWNASTPANEPVLVTSNSFTDAAYVFYGYNNQGIEATVQTNTLVHVQGTYSGYYNVYLDEVSKPTNSNYHIYGNTFTGSLFGTYIRNTSGARVISNDITVKKPANTGIFNAPVWIEDCQLITVAQNSLDCNPTNSTSWNTFGVFAGATPSLTIKCNDIVKTSACLKLQSDCNPTTIYRNSLNNTGGTDPCTYGVWLDNVAKTGDIGYFDGTTWRMSDDVWGDFGTADTKCQLNSNTLTPVPANTYKIYYDAGKTASLYQPQVNLDTYDGSGDFSRSYIPTSTTNSNSAQCNEGARMMNQSVSSSSGPVKSGGSFNTNSGPHKLILLNNGNERNRLANVNDSLFHLVDSLIEEYKKNNNLSGLNAARNTNAGISAANDIEQNQKEFYSIYCTFLEDPSLVTASQKQDLKSMAMLCPFTDGLAVYQSRGLIRHWDDSTHYYNTCENSTPDLVEENARVASQKAAMASQQQAEVYPNPSNGTLMVKNNCKNCTFEVYDLLGKKVLSRKLNENETKVDLNTLNNGTYLYKIVQDGTLIKADKLLLTK